MAAPIAALLALTRFGLGFEGSPYAVLLEGPPRLFEVAARRGPVVGIGVLAWLIGLAAALALGPGPVRRTAARLFALAAAYLPLLLLAGAALEPGVGEERLLVTLGGPALAALTLAAFAGQRGGERRGYRALAVACGASVLASAADVIAGSPLTQLSLAGPNPAGGHRFYGIGNELEAILAVLVVAGTGAALAGFAPPGWDEPRKRGAGAWPPAWRGAAAFLCVAVFFAFVFGYGRFGADVGAAIVLPLGGAVAAAVLTGHRGLALLAALLPLPALAALAAIDLLSGSGAHLTTTVLQAGDGGDVLAVLGRRLGEAGESFGRTVLLIGLPFVLAGAALAWLRRQRLGAWLRGVPAMRAGLAGALAATLVGTVANDSGALLLELGAFYLAAFLGYVWAEAARGASTTLSASCGSPSYPHTPGAIRAE